MRYEWKPRSSDTFRRASDEDGDWPGFWIQTIGGDWRGCNHSIAQEAATEILRLAHELQVERAHREAAERQRDDKAEEIRCLRGEREQLLRRLGYRE